MRGNTRGRIPSPVRRPSAQGPQRFRSETWTRLSRFFVLMLLGVFVCCAVSCDPGVGPIDINQVATQTAQAELGAPDAFTYRGVSLSGLERYRAALTMTFKGQVGGVEKGGALHMLAHVDTLRKVATSRIWVEGDAKIFGADFPPLGTKTYLDGVDYITSAAESGEEACFARPANVFDPLAYNVLSPNMFLLPEEVPPLALVGAGPLLYAALAPAWRFRVAGFDTATVKKAWLEIVTAGAGEWVVTLDLQGEGYFSGQEDAQGTLGLHYELAGIDQSVEVGLPPACAPTPTPPPSPTPAATPAG